MIGVISGVGKPAEFLLLLSIELLYEMLLGLFSPSRERGEGLSQLTLKDGRRPNRLEGGVGDGVKMSD